MKELDKKSELNSNICLQEFLKLTCSEIAEIIKIAQKPKNVTVMIDGTRRILKLKLEHHSDPWLYQKTHIETLMEKSIEVTDWLFDMGVNVVTGPLASFGNLHRQDFIPTGLEHLLSPLLKEQSLEIINKHQAHVTFYGDTEYVKNLPGGESLKEYQHAFQHINEQIAHPKKQILIGLGFTTDRETTLIAHQAINFYKETGRLPTQEDLITKYFGNKIPPVDIFIRTNELKSSGGLTPLLTHHDTQFYFPVSPGLISLTKTNIKRILYDYLFNRNLSAGTHQHQPINADQAKKISNFYHNSQDKILGVGDREGDIWIHDAQ